TRRRPIGSSFARAATLFSKSSEARANITTVVISSLLRMNRRVVSRPMPREAPVTSAVLLIVVLLGPQEEPCHLEIGLGGHLQVLVGALDEVHGAAEVRHQRGVLGELE